MLTFDASAHEYRYHGEVLPGVTSILKELSLTPPYPESDGTKISIGSRVHELTASYDYGMIGRDRMLADPELAPYCSAYLQFLHDCAPQWTLIERAMSDHDPLRWYAGTVDRIGHLMGRYIVADLKCTNSVARSTNIQVAAYTALAHTCYGIPMTAGRYAIRLSDNGRYQLLELPNEDHAWEAALRLYHWKRRTAEKKGWC